MVYMIFDLEVIGHHLEFVAHLVNHSASFLDHARLIVVGPPGYSKKLSPLLIKPIERNGNTCIIEVAADRYAQVEKQGSALYELTLAREIASHQGATRLYLMHINKYQLALGKASFSGLPFEVRGILFNPLGKVVGQRTVLLVVARKLLQLVWLLRNRSVSRIYLLNNRFLATFLNQLWWWRRPFRDIADPIPVEQLSAPSNVKARSRNEKVSFLLFGSLSMRKGLFLVIEAFRNLPVEMRASCELVLAGSVIDRDTDRFQTALARLRADAPSLLVTHHDEFLDYRSVGRRFQSADYILVPYIGNQSSSGVLGLAAHFGTPVIGSSRGVVGRIIHRYDLGITVPSLSAKKMSSVLADVVSKDIDFSCSSKADLYRQRSLPQDFARRVLDES